MIKQGDIYKHQVTFTQEQVDQFAEVTGDKNPIHINAEYASKSIFKRPIVHGFLAGSVFSMVFGTLFPGEGTIYLFQDMKFTAPTFVNEPYEAVFEVVEVNTDKHIGTIRCTLVNAQGEPTIIGTAKLKHNEHFV